MGAQSIVVVYVIARRAREDTEVGGFRVPRDSEVIIWVAQRHRLSLAPGERVVARPRITLVPKHGIRMELASRRPPRSST